MMAGASTIRRLHQHGQRKNEGGAFPAQTSTNSTATFTQNRMFGLKPQRSSTTSLACPVWLSAPGGSGRRFWWANALPPGRVAVAKRSVAADRIPGSNESLTYIYALCRRGSPANVLRHSEHVRRTRITKAPLRTPRDAFSPLRIFFF